MDVKTPELEKFISEVDQKVRRMMAVEFVQHEVMQINVGIGQGQLELRIALADKKMLQKNKIVGARGPLGIPQGQA